MRPELLLQPIHNSTADLLKCFALGKPLTPDQLHFVEWHLDHLNSAAFDPVFEYYIQLAKKKHKTHHSFLLPDEELNPEAIKKLKERLKALLAQRSARAQVKFTQKQFIQFKQFNIHELIFWHGNQFLTNAPFIPGGIPPVILFQWGNLFGIVKYVILAGEKELKSNILIYFEDMQERNLNECVDDYRKTLALEQKEQSRLLLENKIEQPAFEKFIIAPSSRPNRSIIA